MNRSLKSLSTYDGLPSVARSFPGTLESSRHGAARRFPRVLENSRLSCRKVPYRGNFFRNFRQGISQYVNGFADTHPFDAPVAIHPAYFNNL
ncbi:MAG: hypothetical protein LBL07_18485 [Tannerella sp.]|nr:hypothetical protein [Tannerella sp.]